MLTASIPEPPLTAQAGVVEIRVRLLRLIQADPGGATTAAVADLWGQADPARVDAALDALVRERRIIRVRVTHPPEEAHRDHWAYQPWNDGDPLDG